jgi:hypothetical protein
MVSQIFRGDRHLTPEQALSLSEFLGLGDLAAEYFILLVQVARAGTHAYRQRLERRLEVVRAQSRDLKTRLPRDKEMTEEVKATFYSRWYFSGVRLATSVDALGTADRLAAHFQLPLARVNQVLEFLLNHGLCVEQDGRLAMGPRRTHLGADSPLIGRHHLNWRTQAITKLDRVEEDELFYTAPMALARDLVPEIRAELVRLIESVNARVVPSASETLACLNIDWFKF